MAPLGRSLGTKILSPVGLVYLVVVPCSGSRLIGLKGQGLPPFLSSSARLQLRSLPQYPTSPTNFCQSRSTCSPIMSSLDEAPIPFFRPAPSLIDRIGPLPGAQDYPISIASSTSIVRRGVAGYGERVGRGGRGGRGGGRNRGGHRANGLRRGHATRTYRPPFRRGEHDLYPETFMMNNRAIIDAMPQLPPALASNPTTTPTSGSNVTSLYPSCSASVYSASSVATAEDFLTPQTRVPSPNPPGFYDPADFHRLTRDQVVSLLDCRSAPELFDRYMFVPQYIDDIYQSIMSALVHHFQRFPAANAEERASQSASSAS
ncbi:hypothetical protein PTTG_29125 [Puccinia triticina 1-1 BBBD Race 1]|uniref:Uncharacterized protein n=1 Tax=Puccinia triticina (isolate 1-1 / race 1 (BBBD)) TaxID=630390 RepID=A0A180G759_PUCT1|nr:hypothetical protein PTTG_29125 [Puccinia triticina 1-1 BBBD Race 1]